MKIGIIIETNEPEKAWNVFRFANTARKEHDVRVFLMGEAVECESIHDAKYDVAEQLRDFVRAGGELLACRTCLESRQLEEATQCPVSTMAECVEVVIWADRVVTF